MAYYENIWTPWNKCFYDPVLVLYSVITDVEAWDRLWHSEVHDRWAVLMSPLMEFNSDGIVNSTELREVFHLETNAGK